MEGMQTVDFRNAGRDCASCFRSNYICTFKFWEFSSTTLWNFSWVREHKEHQHFWDADVV